MVHLANITVSSPMTTYKPADGRDVVRLSASLHALPALRIVEIQALRRKVLIDQMGDFQHLTLACADIRIHPKEAAKLARLKSLHLMCVTGHPETVFSLIHVESNHGDVL